MLLLFKLTAKSNLSNNLSRVSTEGIKQNIPKKSKSSIINFVLIIKIISKFSEQVAKNSLIMAPNLSKAKKGTSGRNLVDKRSASALV